MKITLYSRFMRGLAKLIFPKAKIVADTEIDSTEPAVFICNHAGAVGPSLMTLYFEIPHRTWIINYVLDKKKNTKFIYNDFMVGPGKKCQPFWKALAKVVAVLLRPLLEFADPIPVYHDKRIMNTFRDSVETLEGGKSVVLFAECPNRYSEYVNDMYSGFVDIGRSFYTSTGKRVKFYPVYAEKNNRVIRVGKPISFDPDIHIKEHRENVKDYIRDSIDKMGRELPEHVPVPFLTEEWYLNYGKYVDNISEYWRLFD